MNETQHLAANRLIANQASLPLICSFSFALLSPDYVQLQLQVERLEGEIEQKRRVLKRLQQVRRI